jgi:hypothetical protein
LDARNRRAIELELVSGGGNAPSFGLWRQQRSGAPHRSRGRSVAVTLLKAGRSPSDEELIADLMRLQQWRGRVWTQAGEWSDRALATLQSTAPDLTSTSICACIWRAEAADECAEVRRCDRGLGIARKPAARRSCDMHRRRAALGVAAYLLFWKWREIVFGTAKMLLIYLLAPFALLMAAWVLSETTEILDQPLACMIGAMAAATLLVTRARAAAETCAAADDRRVDGSRVWRTGRVRLVLARIRADEGCRR